MTVTVSTKHKPTAAERQLMTGFSGDITWPEDDNYDDARAVWNDMIDRYPVLIAHCRSVDDVVAAVNHGREQGLPIAVRGGSHNVAGLATCDGGIVIDLSPMKRIDVDPDARIARAGGGVTWGELDAATQKHGLATPGGVYSDTGIAGLTLGGGFGWIRSKYGLSCDNLIGAEVVTASGEVVRASADENPELLWGLRGGGGNFGVVTTFEYKLHPVGPDVYFLFVLHDSSGDRFKQSLRLFREFSANAPDEVSLLQSCGIVPPDEDHFPEEIHHKPFAAFAGLFAGDPDEGREVLRPLLEFGEPLLDASGVVPYVEAQQAFDEDYPDGLRYYWKSLNLNDLSDEAIDRIVEHSRRQPSVLSTIDLWHIGGVVKRPGPDDSAFFGRSADFLLNMEANWEDADDDEANIRWVRELIDTMQDFSDSSAYLNFAGFQEEGDEMVRAAFKSQYGRLAELKDWYDPENIFHLNQNIKPNSA